MACTRASTSGRRVRGTTASCTTSAGAMRPMAPNAFFRPCHSRARSSAVAAARTPRAPCASQQARTSAASSSSAPAGPSTSTSRIASASTG